MSNILLLFIVALIGIGLTIFSIYKMRNETADRDITPTYTMESLVNKVKNKLAEVGQDTTDLIAYEEEDFDAMYARISRVNLAMKNCVYCIDSAKAIVQELIREEIAYTLPEEDDVLSVINFKDIYLNVMVKFEIIMYHYKKEKRLGKNALAQFISDFSLDTERYYIEDQTQTSYVITDEDIEVAYRKLNIELDYDKMLDILSVLVYQRYKGLGIIDTIREMNINGINVGVSGSILSKFTGGVEVDTERHPDANRCVWVQNKGRYIHFRFMAFEDMEDIKKITNLIIRYNSPGSLTEKRAIVVNTMYDRTRVLAMREPVSSSWGFFLRKFTIANNSLSWLLNPKIETEGEDGVVMQIPKYKNTDLPIESGIWAMKGQVTTAVTGRQSSGKTTTMKAFIKHIDPKLNIRVLEMAPEMYLRELHPERNIFEAQETDYASSTDIQNAFKKSDGGVTIIGEVATAEMMARFVESCNVASQYGLMSSHFMTVEALVEQGRNQLVAATPGLTASAAEQQIINAIPLKYHQDFDLSGDRFVERITEIIPLAEGVPYPVVNESDALLSIANIFREYAMRSTDRKTYTARDLVIFDKVTREYKVGAPPSKKLVNHMITHMETRDIPDYIRFLEKNWGGAFKC